MRLCKQCGVKPVQGCRCNIGADYCKECHDAHPGPQQTFEEVVEMYVKQGVEKLYDKISKDILDAVE